MTPNNCSIPRRACAPSAWPCAALFLTATWLAAWPVSAQTPATKDETVILSAFEVRAEATSRYQVSEASSGGRIRLNLMDTPASLTVITKELLEDVGADRLLDALKYTSGVTESITPNGLERVTLRGFQSDFTVMDGFRTNTGQMNFDPAIMDRVEVMKGPNAILQPQGTPGGTVNGVTKNPTLGESSGRASLQAGRFDANRATFDYNGVAVPNKLAYRLVLAGQYSDGWWDATHTHRYMINPGVLYQFGPSTRLVVKGYFSDYRVQTYGGVPIDPAVGTRDKLRIFPGLDRRSNMRGPGEQRVDNREEGTFFLTSRMGDHLSVRLAGRLANLTTNAFGTNPGGLSAGGAVNPLNGEWVGGTVFGPAPTFTPAPAPAVNPVAVRSGGDNTNFVKVTNLQNDYAFQYDFKSVKTTTTAGIAYTDFSVISFGRVGNRGVLDIRNTRATQNAPTVFGPITSYNFSTLEEVQLYGQEQASFFADRLIVSGGASTNRVKSTRRREITAPGLVEVSPARNLDSFSYGLVYKPAPSVSLYFGHSANAVARVSFTGSLAPAEITTAEGVQDEAGVKLSFAEGRVFVTLAYFDLRQTNFVVANPLNFASPPPSPPLPNLLFDRVSKGWEVNVNATLTKELAIMGNYYHGKNRDPNGIPFQASADDSGGLFARYDFSQPALKGLGCSLGVDYLGRRPGIQASGVTAASTSTNVIYVQPSFYVPARTLLNGAVYYTRGAMRYQLNVDNVLNTKYLTGTFTRTGIWVGTPINFKLSVTREL